MLASVDNPFPCSATRSPEVIPPGRDDIRAIPAVAAQRRICWRSRGIDISHEDYAGLWNRFVPAIFAAEIRKKRVARMLHLSAVALASG